MRAFWAIVGTTWLETIRLPASFLLATVSYFATLLVPVLNFHQFGEPGRLVRDSGLSCLLVFGMTLAVGAAGRALAREIESGTAAAVIARPVSRSQFLLAKTLGVLGAVAVFAAAQIAATLVAGTAARGMGEECASPGRRHLVPLLAAFGFSALAYVGAAVFDLRRRARFGAAVFPLLALAQVAALGVAATGVFGALPDLRLLGAALPLLAALAVLVFLASALSTRLKTPAVLVVCAAYLAMGFAVPLFPRAVGALLFDIQNYWLCDALAAGGVVPGSYIAASFAAAALSCAAFFALGSLLFRTRDVR